MKLPLNCSVDYIPDFLSPAEAAELYELLINEYRINQARLTIEAGGRLIETDSFKILFVTPRIMELNSYPESIHGKTFEWVGLMASLRDRVEERTNKQFEVAMCLFYPNGNYFAPYHTDQQTSGVKTIIPSLSLGEVREFCFNENDSGEKFSLDLADGSLLVMGDYCQNRYMHTLPKNPKYRNGRINITFREPDFK